MIDPGLYELKEYTDSTIKKEKELNAKEKILEANREGTKLSWRDIDFVVDQDAVFR